VKCWCKFCCFPCIVPEIKLKATVLTLSIPRVHSAESGYLERISIHNTLFKEGKSASEASRKIIPICVFFCFGRGSADYCNLRSFSYISRSDLKKGEGIRTRNVEIMSFLFSIGSSVDFDVWRIRLSSEAAIHNSIPDHTSCTVYMRGCFVFHI
jgi:hypothetical protein